MKLCECECGKTVCKSGNRWYIIEHDMEGKRITKTCPSCDKEFNVKPSLEHRVFCSYGCKLIYQTREKITKTCLICGKEFQVCRSLEHAKFCSENCYSIYLTK